MDDKQIKLRIWNASGDQIYRYVRKNYYIGAMGILLVFDITNMESFQNLNKWIYDIRAHAPNNAIITLVGNKSDLEDQRVVSTEAALAYAEQNNINYIEVSARDSGMIESMFLEFTREIHGIFKPIAIADEKKIKIAYNRNKPFTESDRANITRNNRAKNKCQIM